MFKYSFNWRRNVFYRPVPFTILPFKVYFPPDEWFPCWIITLLQILGISLSTTTCTTYSSVLVKYLYSFLVWVLEYIIVVVFVLKYIKVNNFFFVIAYTHTHTYLHLSFANQNKSIVEYTNAKRERNFSTFCNWVSPFSLYIINIFIFFDVDIFWSKPWQRAVIKMLHLRQLTLIHNFMIWYYFMPRYRKSHPIFKIDFLKLSIGTLSVLSLWAEVVLDDVILRARFM